MKPESLFLKQPKHFWANVRSISQHIGYTERQNQRTGSSLKVSGKVKVPTPGDMVATMDALGLRASHIRRSNGKPTRLGLTLQEYFAYRAEVLNGYVEPLLMDRAQAKSLFESLRTQLKPKRAFPMNKQKGKKRAEAYFTCIVNMLIESNSEGFSCDFSPRELTTITVDGAPRRTLARWVDGAFPSTVNPIAVWEIKEYYNTTTFGSRVADGVYESLLDGMELEELREHEKIDVKHVLMIDDHFTWWTCGRSYLCRIVDMLHMGYVDEVFFGREVVEQLPAAVKRWLAVARKHTPVQRISDE